MTGNEIVLTIAIVMLVIAYVSMEIRHAKQIKVYRDREKKRMDSMHEDWTETRESGRLAELRGLQLFIERRIRMSRERYEASFRKKLG